MNFYLVPPNVTTAHLEVQQRLGDELLLECQCHSWPPGRRATILIFQMTFRIIFVQFIQVLLIGLIRRTVCLFRNGRVRVPLIDLKESIFNFLKYWTDEGGERRSTIDYRTRVDGSVTTMHLSISEMLQEDQGAAH